MPKPQPPSTETFAKNHLGKFTIFSSNKLLSKQNEKPIKQDNYFCSVTFTTEVLDSLSLTMLPR